eukprot:CAMPEP_0175174372 /NCGR_PEP_ID=MMETSP0087-20121206/32595_1 /TAXON_ID=136419 /ORGANISM="Unknown Unknown, Strain D1" /LENGTH=227 /DNA_ID=CAMNT_0016465833 /DNA_START=647 /DNA_END=1328 /DNA_ORIENTATION=+
MAPERTNPAVLLPTSKLPTCWKSAGLCSCGTRGTQNSEAVVEIGVGEPLPFVGGGLVGCGGCGGCLLEVVGGGGKASFVGGVVGGVVGFVVAGAGAGGKLGGAGAGGHPVGEETNIVGDSVGDRVGAKVVGAVVGNRVGAVVGDRVGAKVVGDTVGDWVGAKELYYVVTNKPVVTATYNVAILAGENVRLVETLSTCGAPVRALTLAIVAKAPSVTFAVGEYPDGVR